MQYLNKAHLKGFIDLYNKKRVCINNLHIPLSFILKQFNKISPQLAN